jgi:DNA-binding MarR family transcriptional regulator
MARPLPLSALLSHALVALTIEIDNTYEARAPHGTTERGGTGPWLVSYAMWANFLRLVPPDGIPSRQLAADAGWNDPKHPSLSGMERWGYVSVEPDIDDARARPPKGDLVIRRTRKGQRSAEHWAPVADDVEERWVGRFGAELVDELRERAADLVAASGLRLPAYLPQLAWELRTYPPATDDVVPGEPSLVTALANALHAFAIEYEQAWPVPLAAGANVLRVVDETGLRVRDLPKRTGISKAGTSWATGVLEHGFVRVEPDPSSSRGKVVVLTDRGAEVRAAYEPRATAVEAGWAARLGDVVEDLRSALEELVALDDGERLWSGLEPPVDGWRVGKKRPDTLPHFPMVLHRGGYPDGG